MGCYYGCQTPQNKFAWSIYVGLLVLALALVIALEIHMRACITGWYACGGDVLMAAVQQYDFSKMGLDAVTFNNAGSLCDQMIQTVAIGSITSPADHAELTTRCVACTRTAHECLGLSGYLLIGALVAFFATVFPCIFFCCFASKYVEAKEEDSQKLQKDESTQK